MLLSINFSKNLNGKLLNDNFGTCRLHNSDKYFIGAEHEIILNEVVLGIARIYAVRTFNFKDIRDALSWLDAGMSAAQFAGMLKNMYTKKFTNGMEDTTQFDHIVYHWIKRTKDGVDKIMNAQYERITDNFFTGIDLSA